MMAVLGIDVGTTGTKALLVDERGQVVSQGYQAYDSIRDAGGIVEQDARDWWISLVGAVDKACGGMDRKQIKGLSLSTQGASSVLVDENGNPLHNAITWMDLRALPQKAALEAQKGSDWFYRRTGWGLNASLDACKALWLYENRHDLVEKAAYYLSTVEYLNMQLTGNPVIDPSNAAMRQMMHLDTLQWDPEILDLVKLPRKLLPTICPAGDCVGTLTQAAAEALGLATDTRVFNGAHDQYCCGLGSGSVSAGDTYLGTGTAWALMHNTAAPLFTASYISPGPHILPGLWSALTSIPCGGVVLDWVMKNAVHSDYDTLNREVAQRMGREGGLLFYPHFTGAACPVWDSSLRGSISGLELHHDSFDLALAAMEGVAFQTAVLLEEYRNNGAKVGSLRVMGGAGKSGPWMEILSSVSGCAIHRVKVTDAAPLGAAMIAAVQCGFFEDYSQAAKEMVQWEALPAPAADIQSAYQSKLQSFKAHWPSIISLY